MVSDHDIPSDNTWTIHVPSACVQNRDLLQKHVLDSIQWQRRVMLTSAYLRFYNAKIPRFRGFGEEPELVEGFCVQYWNNPGTYNEFHSNVSRFYPDGSDELIRKLYEDQSKTPAATVYCIPEDIGAADVQIDTGAAGVQ